MSLTVRKCVLGRPVAKELKPIAVLPKDINVGYGKFQLRPDGSRDPRVECRIFAKMVMDINGLSGQQTG